MSNLFLSIIIPCYNEKNNLDKNVLSQIHNFLAKKKFKWEVIISDDGSSDGSRIKITKQIKNWNNFKMLRNSHGGKPSAIMKGIKEAKGKYVLFTDMDQSTPIDQLDKLLPFLKLGYKVIIGSRGLVRENFPLYRKAGSFVFASFRKLFLLREIDDTQCGFKLFDRLLVTNAFSRLQFFKKESYSQGWKVTSYDVELLHVIKKMGEKIKEVGVNWQDTDVSSSKGGGFGRYFKESQDMFIQILRVKLNDMKGLYNH